MKGTSYLKRCAVMIVSLALVAMTAGGAAAQTAFSRIVVFGDSLSDPGNEFALEGKANTPPYDLLDQYLIIPAYPYARGGHHYSNGMTWIETLAIPLGLHGTTRPAFQSRGTKATNYAVGGGRAHDDGINVNLSAQVQTFLNTFNGVAPSDALYVVEFGSNDLRDVLYTGQGAILQQALGAVAGNIGVLYANGARKFLVVKVPDFSLTPVIRTMDSANPNAGIAVLSGMLSGMYNAGLENLLTTLEGQLPGIEIKRLDLYTMLHDLVGDPAKYGIEVADRSCITPYVAPYACGNPDEYLFWDGMHPTRTVHGIMAQEAASVLGN